MSEYAELIKDLRGMNAHIVCESCVRSCCGQGDLDIGKCLLLEAADAIEELYRKYGYFSEDQVSLVREGAEGAALIGRIMDAFRDGKPDHFGKFNVEKTTDYINGYEDIPASNVLRFDLGKGTWFAMRPSGTEPKIKFYYYSVADTKDKSAKTVEEMKEAVDGLIREVK